MFRRAAALAAIAMIASCSSRREDAPAAGSGSASAPAPGTLRAIAELRAPATLIAGTRRIALSIGDAWYEPDASGLAPRPALGAAIARASAELPPPLDTFLGAAPIVSGGEEHRERTLRFAPQPQSIALHGVLAQVATAGAIEVWRYEHELRSELAIVDAAGALAPLPALPLAGPPAEAASPVSAKACAAPKVRDLAGADAAVLALITECHRSAPVRIATYRAAAGALAPAVVAPLGTLAELDLEGIDLLATRAGEPILVGRRGGAVAVLRFSGGAPAVALGPRDVEVVTHAAVADDGAVWTRTVGARAPRVIVIARNGSPVALTGPAGTAVRPESLAFDARLGVVVLAAGASSQWLFAEHPETGPVRVLPGR